MLRYHNLNSIKGEFQGILLDAYGVFWGGNAVGLLPHAKEAMERQVKGNRIVGILSNTTQSSLMEKEKLKAHGVLEKEHYHFLITSGDIAKKVFQNEQFPFKTPHKKFWLFGDPHPKFSSHKTLFEDSIFEETDKLSEADFIFINIPHIDGVDQLDPLAFQDKIDELKSYNHLPMICVNPDQFAHEGHPPRLVVRQGSIAILYEKLGGKAFYIGKPSQLAFKEAIAAFKQYGITDNILMVGDTPETDIRGAKSLNLKTALITSTGITSDRLLRDNNYLNLIPESDTPDFLIDLL